MQNKTVWVIGASSGLGKFVAEAFSKNGYTVIGGARSFQGRAEQNYHQLTLDVCLQHSIDAFIKKALAISSAIDIIVYCAGNIFFGPSENLESFQYAQIMDSNFYGAQRIVSSIMPILRKQGKGKILLFSSINGIIATPFQSAYVASKHAMEGYAKCLASELNNSNIQICLIRPGDHCGGSIQYRQRFNAYMNNIQLQQQMEKAIYRVLKDEESGSSPKVLANKIVALCKRNRLPLSYTIAKPVEKLAILLSKVLPGKLFYKLIQLYFQH
ncbi:MAG: SDR family NAD(P)-dependent oxidoreductase [Eubacteriales bacterium]|nr:SDR family NAD(P)-dependent oxidoreductase [Eubacteriales bacterium]